MTETLQHDLDDNEPAGGSLRDDEITNYQSNDTKRIILSDVERQWLLACCECDYDTMARMLNKNPELINWRSFINGYAAAHYAAKFGAVVCIKLLFGTHKADVDIRNHKGETPLHVAYYFKQEEVIRMLEDQYACNKKVHDFSGLQPINECNKRYEDEVKFNPTGKYLREYDEQRASHLTSHSATHVADGGGSRSLYRGSIAIGSGGATNGLFNSNDLFPPSSPNGAFTTLHPGAATAPSSAPPIRQSLLGGSSSTSSSWRQSFRIRFLGAPEPSGATKLAKRDSLRTKEISNPIGRLSFLTKSPNRRPSVKPIPES